MKQIIQRVPLYAIKVVAICHFLFFLFFSSQLFADYLANRSARITNILDEQVLVGVSDRSDWVIGEIVAVVSKNSKRGVIAFVEVVNSPSSAAAVGNPSEVKSSSLENTLKTYEVKFRLVRQSRKYLIQTGDSVRRLDLTRANPEYIGSTELLIHQSDFRVSARYRPFVYQGFGIGDTAQTLYEKEFLVNYFGNVFYGYKDWLTLGTLVPANLVGGPNASFRARFYKSESTTLSAGLSYVGLQAEDESTLNLNLYWDSTSSDSLISHTFLGLGLVRWKSAADLAAIKALGSSSFQTGYEVILNNWDRFLIGPSYNFEKKALGGYLSYIWILDHFHFQASINATDITHFRLDPADGYFGFVDMYWRF